MIDFIAAAHVYNGMSLILGSVRYKVTSTKCLGEDKIMFSLWINGLKASLMVNAADEMCVYKEN